MAAPRPDARIACPLCGQPVHPIAGRCKHCKGDLGALRAPPVIAAAVLPPLVAGPGMPLPAAAQVPTVRGPRWPLVVIVVSVLATAGAVGVLILGDGGESGSDALEKFGEEQEAAMAKRLAAQQQRARPALDVSAVRPPLPADLADYTGHLPAYGQLQARIDTSLGTIHCELFPDKAPLAVANFVGLATGMKPWLDPKTGQVQKGKPFYDGLVFHRVIEEFMIQGGDPLGAGTGGPGYTFANEASELKMEPGSLAMANAGPNTNGSQFFITEGAPDWLDGKHTIFGKCGDLHVVRLIARVRKSSSDKPVTDVTMTITISK